MGIEIGAYEAKTKLPEILRRVEAGESFTITNRGVPVADLVPSKEAQRQAVKGLIEQMKRAPKFRITEEQYQQYREEGRQ